MEWNIAPKKLRKSVHPTVNCRCLRLVAVRVAVAAASMLAFRPMDMPRWGAGVAMLARLIRLESGVHVVPSPGLCLSPVFAQRRTFHQRFAHQRAEAPAPAAVRDSTAGDAATSSTPTSLSHPDGKAAYDPVFDAPIFTNADYKAMDIPWYARDPMAKTRKNYDPRSLTDDDWEDLQLSTTRKSLITLFPCGRVGSSLHAPSSVQRTPPVSLACLCHRYRRPKMSAF